MYYTIPEPIKEGAVEISWEFSEVQVDKIKAIISIDFGMTDLSSSEAADVQRAIVNVLRVGLKVQLGKFK